MSIGPIDTGSLSPLTPPGGQLTPAELNKIMNSLAEVEQVINQVSSTGHGNLAKIEQELEVINKFKKKMSPEAQEQLENITQQMQGLGQNPSPANLTLLAQGINALAQKVTPH